MNGGFIIALVLLVILLFPLKSLVIAVAARRILTTEGFNGGPWHNYTNVNGTTIYNRINIDQRRNLLMLTRNSETKIFKIHSIYGGRIDDRGLPVRFDDKTFLSMSFGPNLDTLTIYQPTCGIMEARINGGPPRTFYIMESSAVKYPMTDNTGVAVITLEKFAIEKPNQPITTLPQGMLTPGGNPLMGKWYSYEIRNVVCVAAPCNPIRFLNEITIGEREVFVNISDSAVNGIHAVQNIQYADGVHTIRTSAGNLFVREIAGGVVTINGFIRKNPVHYYRNVDNARMNAIEYDFNGEIITPEKAREGFHSGGLINFPTRLNTVETAGTDYTPCNPPVLPLYPRIGSAAAAASRELGTLS